MTSIEPPNRAHDAVPADPRRLQVTPIPEVPVVAAEPLSFDGVPAEPPPDVLAEVDAAIDRLDALRERQLSLRFEVRDGQRVRIDVVDDEGKVIRSVPPTEAIEIVTGDADAADKTTTKTDEPTRFDGKG